MTVRTTAYALAAMSLVVAAFSAATLQESAAALAFVLLVVGTSPGAARLTLRPARDLRRFLALVAALPLLSFAFPAATEIFATCFYVVLILLLLSRAIHRFSDG